MSTYPVSPNTVLANALSHAQDVLTPRVLDAAPERIVFVVGTQINGAPHIGTSLVQSLTFATAARVREKFGVPVEVRFAALDNAPHAIVTDPATGHRYMRTYAHALGEQAITEQTDALYRPLFAALSELLAVPYAVETYSQQQATEHYRRTWLWVGNYRGACQINDGELVTLVVKVDDRAGRLPQPVVLLGTPPGPAAI